MANHFSLPKGSVQIQMIPSAKGVASQLQEALPLDGKVPPIAKTVPTLLCHEEGSIISESVAMAEELHTRHPDAGLFPSDPKARAACRTLVSEMATGFSALRSECPMNFRYRYADSRPSPEVLKDIDRLEKIWEYARDTAAVGDGPWLLGQDYTVADAFFAPIVVRIAGYSLPLNTSFAKQYTETHFADPVFRRWRTLAMTFEGSDRYSKPYQVAPTHSWPGPKPLAAKALESLGDRKCENDKCPYSGLALTDYLELTDSKRVFGFCNPHCRDKTVVDPEAYPEFMELVNSKK